MSTTEKEKFVSVAIPFKGARGAFLKIEKAEARKPKAGQAPNPNAPKFYSGEIILDPTKVEHQATIALIKSESVRALNHRFGTPENPTPFNVAVLEQVATGERAPPGFHLCWGYGNALPAFGKKIYDGYKDMFWVRAKRNETDGRPITLNRDGKPVIPGDAQYPYSGCVLAGVIDIWSYNNESRGVNSTMRTLVYQDKGAAFGKGAVDGAADFAAIGDLGPAVAGSGGTAARGPFDI
ncbi:MAG: ssDNA-binding protein [Steroidobacteraceae bacterium]